MPNRSRVAAGRLADSASGLSDSADDHGGTALDAQSMICKPCMSTMLPAACFLPVLIRREK